MTLAWTGCGTVNHTQYHVAGPGRADSGVRAVVQPADRDAAKEIVQSIASELKLRDMTDTSVVPNVIVYYQQIDTETPVKLCAWTRGGEIIVDLIQTPGTPGETLLYRTAKEKLLAALEQQFGKRMSLAPYQKELKPAATPAPAQ